MSIERAIERMDKDTRDCVKELSALYKKTGNEEYAEKMLEIIQQFDDDKDLTIGALVKKMR